MGKVYNVNVSIDIYPLRGNLNSFLKFCKFVLFNIIDNTTFTKSNFHGSIG